MLIAADVGGTNTRLGLFHRDVPRPRPVTTREYETQRHDTFAAILSSFVREAAPPTIEAIAVGVAGPVVKQSARLTNVTWDVSAAAISVQLGVSRVRLLNDLEAMASAVNVLAPDELATLQGGRRDPEGNAVVMAAGTGLGQAYLPRNNGLNVLASEAGHADFAARTDRELDLVRALRAEFGRASVEHVLSGPGLCNLHRFTHARGGACAIVTDLHLETAAARISQSAMNRHCSRCVEALDMFVDALGAEAGNLGLRGTATAGVYLGGGIAPRILPAIREGAFMAAFLDKAPMDDLVRAMPVHVILNRDAGLLGAAVVAASLA